MQTKVPTRTKQSVPLQEQKLCSNTVLGTQDSSAMVEFGDYRYMRNPHGQLKSDSMPDNRSAIQRKAANTNNTGLPNQLKAGIESMSGMSMDTVKVHYNSSKPAHLNALAYAQGRDIHLAPGQEQHLPHEAWHVVQQAQGRVKPTAQIAGMEVNDQAHLEAEADAIGNKVLVQRFATNRMAGMGAHPDFEVDDNQTVFPSPHKSVIQCKKIIGYRSELPLVQFERDEPTPNLEGFLEGDPDHEYILPKAGTAPLNTWIKKKSQQETKPVLSARASANEANDVLSALVKELKGKGESLTHSKAGEYILQVYGKLMREYRAVIDLLKKQFASVEKKTQVIMELVSSLGHLVNTVQSLLQQFKVSREKNEELSTLNQEQFSRQLHSNEIFLREQETGLGLVHLLGGGLPTDIIDIIGDFYSEDFDIDAHLDKGSKEGILNVLVDNEELAIREKEAGNQIGKKNYRFGSGDEKKDISERKKLRAELDAKAEELAAKRSVTPKGGGELRSWHLNDTGNLPRTVLKGQHNEDTKMKAGNINKGFAIDQRRSLEQELVSKAQKDLHALWLSEAVNGEGFQPGYIKDFPGGARAFRLNAPSIEPGYIEVNPQGWVEAGSQGRLIYDYIEDRWFLTTDHYGKHFWEIMVPLDFKGSKMSNSKKRGNGERSGAGGSDAGRPGDDQFLLGQMNNCLIDAIVGAAHIEPEAVNVRTIREQLQAHYLGQVGDMLYADQAVVETILASLGVQYTVVLYDVNGQAQEVGGNGDAILQIYHTGGLHYTAYPVNQAQKDAAGQ
ncbi:MAG: DUF4157 domain-containing protein [Undibacterium umbellatum]|uniref:eCIS core domain-containing protein n=1 Tax=Undibacterium umbellatum TaxID=2762300 RepID=UPI003BB57891